MGRPSPPLFFVRKLIRMFSIFYVPPNFHLEEREEGVEFVKQIPG